MPAKAKRQQTDPLALLTLAYSTLVAVILLIALDGRPSLLLPIGIAALPFTAPPRHRSLYALIAAGLMALMVAMLGGGAGLFFAPAAAGLLAQPFRTRIAAMSSRRVAHR